jgi:AcrR family transcriptional regulator
MSLEGKLGFRHHGRMPVEPLTPERRKELTRQTLVEAAAEVFAEKGIPGASLDEIAERAGFTRGAIYSNFGGKDDLILAVLDWFNRTTLAEYSTPEGDPRIRAGDTAAAAEMWRKPLQGHPELPLLAMEFRLHALRDPAFRERLAAAHREQVQRIADYVVQGMQGQAVRLKIAPDEFAEIAWAASEGLVLFASVDEERGERYDRLVGIVFQTMYESLFEPIEST